MTVHAVRLNHAVLFVADLERSIEFYSQAFGMTVMAREPRASAAFLRLPRSGNHHDLGLFGVGAQPPRPRGSLGLYHLAWQVDTIEELEEARHTLAELGAYTGESSHGATKSVYGQDPDGNEFEVMWMLPRAQWGEFENTAPIDRLDLPSEVRRWAGVRTAAELVPLEGRALTRAFTDGTRSRVRATVPLGSLLAMVPDHWLGTALTPKAARTPTRVTVDLRDDRLEGIKALRGDVAAAVRRAGVRLLIRGPRALEMTITYRPVSDQDRTIAVPGADEVATSVTSGCGRAA